MLNDWKLRSILRTHGRQLPLSLFLIVFSYFLSSAVSLRAACTPTLVAGSVLTQNSNSDNGLSFAYTAGAGTHTLLVVHLDWGSGGSAPTAIAYGAQTLTQKMTSADSNAGQMQVWYLVAPLSGSHTLSFTWAGANVPENVSVETYSGVDQTTPFGNTNSSVYGNTGATTFTDTLTTAYANSLIADYIAVGTGDAPSITLNSGQTQAYYDSSSKPTNNYGTNLSAPTAATYNLSYTFGWGDSFASQILEIVSDCNMPTPTPTMTPTGTISPTSTRTSTVTVSPTKTPAMPVVKSSNVASLTLGDTLTFCASWTNDSSATQTIVVWDTVSTYISYLGCSGGCSKTGSLVTWSNSVASGGNGQGCFWGTVSSYPP